MALQGVACSAADACVATGFFVDQLGVYRGLIDTLASGSWSSIEAPVPANAYSDNPPTNPTSPIPTEVPVVAYAGASSYVAVGQYADTRFDAVGLIDTYS
jgi:hypothetical protein